MIEDAATPRRWKPAFVARSSRLPSGALGNIAFTMERIGSTRFGASDIASRAAFAGNPSVTYGSPLSHASTMRDAARAALIEINGSDDDSLNRAEAAAIRLFNLASSATPPTRQAGFNNWALGSDTERSPEE